MLYMQTRESSSSPWKTGYIVDNLSAQRVQAAEVNSHYSFQRVRIVETLGGEVVREIPLDAAADTLNAEGVRNLRRAAADRAAVKRSALV